jgi:uncharacterized membrane protein
MTTKAQAFGSRTEIRANIALNSEFDVACIVMNGLAALVACYGFFENSPTVVIGAMIIAMLLGPLAGVSLALVDRDNPLLGRALGTLSGGIAVPRIREHDCPEKLSEGHFFSSGNVDENVR